MRISLVAAVARGGVIGRDGALPWRLPEDARRFRELTMGHAVVMGRRTWDSLPERFRPLPGRRNVVVTRNPDWARTAPSAPARSRTRYACSTAREQVFVIGGGELYAQALAQADELLLTEIDADVEGDTWFPAWDRDEFEEVSREQQTSETGIPFAFVTYVRRA